jgi:hypothetical protein
MRGTRIEKEVEIYATNLANKTKCMSTNANKWKNSVKTYWTIDKGQTPVILSVIYHRQNPFRINNDRLYILYIYIYIADNIRLKIREDTGDKCLIPYNIMSTCLCCVIVATTQREQHRQNLPQITFVVLAVSLFPKEIGIGL